MARGSKKGGGGVEAASEDNPEVIERKRLKNLALTGSLLSATPARASSPLAVSKIVLKHHGKDIVKKSQRKNKYLFSFPGRLGPISGGKIGDLKDLDTKNPILYLDFPQGRMKLFGTIVFPKNRYLTLDFPRGGKNVTSEDYFNNMIVFSDVCWIGTKEENPDEVRLEFPNAMNEHEYDFKGGVGSALGTKFDCKQIEELESPNVDRESAERKLTDMETTPVKRSMRTVAKKLNFAGGSFGDDSPEDGVKLSAGEENKEHLVTMSDELSGSCSAKPVRQSDNNHSILPQVTIPSLFKKAEGKTEVLRKTTRVTGVRKIGARPNRKEKEMELEDDDDDDIEEYSSSPEIDDDDDDEEDDEDDDEEEDDDEDDEDWDG